MVKSESKRRVPVWLRLPDYKVVALKPECDEPAFELERAIQKGIPAYPDLARDDFYDVPLVQGWAYIHVYRDRCSIYLVAHSVPPLSSSGKFHNQRAMAVSGARHY